MNSTFPDQLYDNAVSSFLLTARRTCEVIDQIFDNIKQFDYELPTIAGKLSKDIDVRVIYHFEPSTLRSSFVESPSDELVNKAVPEYYNTTCTNPNENFANTWRTTAKELSQVLDLLNQEGMELPFDGEKLSKIFKGSNIAVDLLFSKGADAIETVLEDAGELFEPLLIADASYKTIKWLWNNEDWFRGGTEGTWEALKQIGVTAFDAMTEFLDGHGFAKTINDFSNISKKFNEGYIDGLYAKVDNNMSANESVRTQMINYQREKDAVNSFKMSTERADDYINNGAHIYKMPNWTVSYNPYKDITDNFGLQASDPNLPGFIPSKDNTAHIYPDNTPKEYAPKNGHFNYIQNALQIEGAFAQAGLSGGMAGLEKTIKEYLQTARYLDSRFHTQISKIVETSARQARYNFVRKANDHSGKEVAVTTRQRHASHGGRQPAQQRSVQIIINKPLIDHFTINTSGVNMGIDEFKRKVEQVLIEILNSTNAY